MKKLLAILLTLAMLVPMCGFAEESAPGATRTVIFLKDFNAKVLEHTFQRSNTFTLSQVIFSGWLFR